MRPSRYSSPPPLSQVQDALLQGLVTSFGPLWLPRSLASSPSSCLSRPLPHIHSHGLPRPQFFYHTLGSHTVSWLGIQGPWTWVG